MKKINSNKVLKRYLGIAIACAVVAVCIVQVGMSFQSHDPSQRSQGFLCLAGGLIIVFAKSLLQAIAPGAFS